MARCNCPAAWRASLRQAKQRRRGSNPLDSPPPEGWGGEPSNEDSMVEGSCAGANYPSHQLRWFPSPRPRIRSGAAGRNGSGLHELVGELARVAADRLVEYRDVERVVRVVQHLRLSG